jgi:hypothetical protein
MTLFSEFVLRELVPRLGYSGIADLPSNESMNAQSIWAICVIMAGARVGVSSQLFPLRVMGSSGSGCAAEAIDIGIKSLLRSLLLLCSCVVSVASQAQVVVAVNAHYHHYRHDHRHYYNHHHHCSDLCDFPAL